MKISTASKKVLACALSVALVGAFGAPVAAIAAEPTTPDYTGTVVDNANAAVVLTYSDTATGFKTTKNFGTFDAAFAFAVTNANTNKVSNAVFELKQDTKTAANDLKNLTIVLGGHTLTMATNTGTVTLDGEGVVKGACGGVAVKKGSKVEIAGTASAGAAVVLGSDSKVTLTNGKVTAFTAASEEQADGSSKTATGFSVAIAGGQYTEAPFASILTTANTTVTGGEFKADPTAYVDADSYAVADGGNYTQDDAAGVYTTTDGTNYTKHADHAAAVAAKPGGSGTYDHTYAYTATDWAVTAKSVTVSGVAEKMTLNDAIKAASDANKDVTITLTSDVSLSTLTAATNQLGNATGVITLDGAGHKIIAATGVASAITVKGASVKGVVIKDVTFEAAGTNAIATGTKTTLENVTVKDGAVAADTVKSGSFKDAVSANAIEDGTFEGTVTQTSVNIPSSTKKTAIKGGTFKGTVNADLIEGGSFAGAVDKNSGAKVAIKGGTFTGGVSNATITGGTFKTSPAGIAANYGAYQNEDKTYTVKVGMTASSVTVTNGPANVAIVDEKDAAKKTVAEAVSNLYASLLDETGATPTTTVVDSKLNVVANLAASTPVAMDAVVSTTAVTVSKNATDAAAKAISEAGYTTAAEAGKNGTIAFKTGAKLKSATVDPVSNITSIAAPVSYKVNVTALLTKDVKDMGIAKVSEGKLVLVDSAVVAPTTTDVNTYVTFSSATFGDTYAVVYGSVYEDLKQEVKDNEAAAKEQLAALQDEIAVLKAKGAAKTVKLGKKSKTTKTQTITLKAVKSASGATMTFKKVSGSSKVSVSSAGKATLKKGVKKGTYTVKVTATVGASVSDTLTVKFVVKK